MRLIPTSGAWIETAEHSTRQPGLSDLDPHQRIAFRVEIRRLVEYRITNEVLLQGLPPLFDRMLDNETEEANHALRLLEHRTGEDPLHLNPDLRSRDGASLAH